MVKTVFDVHGFFGFAFGPCVLGFGYSLRGGLDPCLFLLLRLGAILVEEFKELRGSVFIELDRKSVV